MSVTDAKFIVARNLALIPCIVAVLWSLAVTLCREWVKSDLRERLRQPISVRWRFLYSTRRHCAFRVVYCDVQGQIHRASCWTYWYYRSVSWREDEVIGFKS